MRQTMLQRALVIAVGLSGCARTTAPLYDPSRASDAGEIANPGTLPAAQRTDASHSTDASAAATTTIGAPRALAELCDNGVDDDQDGAVDEECTCLLGTRQRCFSGPPALAGVGACSMGTQLCEGAGTDTHWGVCAESGAPSGDACDGFDNDCNGMIDETCPCAPSAGTACYSGPRGTIGVGVCHAGISTCAPNPGDVPEGTLCEGEVVPRMEVCDGIDNDCDGEIDNIPERCDGVDNDCDGIVDEGCILVGQALRRFLGNTASGIIPGDHGSLYVLRPASRVCLPEQVPVESAPDQIDCAPPRPACPPGQTSMFSGGEWRCVPCALVVQYGVLFAGERVCAPEPPTTPCPANMRPTFDMTTRSWICAFNCPGTYDDIRYAGLQMCIPC